MTGTKNEPKSKCLIEEIDPRLQHPKNQTKQLILNYFLSRHITHMKYLSQNISSLNTRTGGVRKPKCSGRESGAETTTTIPSHGTDCLLYTSRCV